MGYRASCPSNSLSLPLHQMHPYASWIGQLCSKERYIRMGGAIAQWLNSELLMQKVLGFIIGISWQGTERVQSNPPESDYPLSTSSTLSSMDQWSMRQFPINISVWILRLSKAL